MTSLVRLALAGLLATLTAGCAAGAGLSVAPWPPAGTAPGAIDSGGTLAADPPEPPSTITLAFGGDVHFEAYVADLLQDPEHSLAELQPTLGAADFSMVNLETAITTGGDRENKAFTFRAPSTALTTLAAGGVDAVSLANNHAVDFGRAGLTDTLAAVAASPIPVVGIGADSAQAYAPRYVDVRGVRVALLSALELWEETATRWSAAEGAGVATSQTPQALALLTAATRDAAQHADLVVVMMHWGTEYATCSDAAQQATAQALEAAGADVIVGGHAHRLQGGGWLGRSYVGYSLGNFVWWRSAEPEARSGVLTLTVDAAAARERGRASGSERRTASSLVTAATWAPLLIGTDGVPRPPREGATTARLAGVWDEAVACSGLRTTPAPSRGFP